MVSPEVAQAALELIHKIQATGESQEIEEADSFIVASFDPETGRSSYVGSFETPIEAFQYAENWATDLNSGNGPDEVPFTTKVYPMFAPTP